MEVLILAVYSYNTDNVSTTIKCIVVSKVSDAVTPSIKIPFKSLVLF